VSALGRYIAGSTGAEAVSRRSRRRQSPSTRADWLRRELTWWAPAPIAVFGVLAAAADGYLTARNPNATPAALSAGGRMVTILALVAGALYAHRHAVLFRYSRALALAVVVVALWLLSGSAEPLPLTIGLLASSVVPTVMCSLLLAYPSGRLPHRGDRVLLTGAGGIVFAGTAALVLLGSVGSLHLPLVACAGRCRTVISLGGAPAAADVLRVVTTAALVTLAWGTVARMTARARLSPIPLRRAVTPLRGVALLYALCLTGWRLSIELRPALSTSLGGAALFISVLVPLAVVLGAGWQRLYMGGALAEFVATLAEHPGADPQTVMAVMLRDPTLRLGYRPLGEGTYLTTDGDPVHPGHTGPGQAVTWVERGHRRVACVVYDAGLVDQEAFIRAAGAAALMLRERAQLKADLRAYAAGLAASRTRLLTMAYAERQSIERDLHDGVQQDLVALRIKLELAEETLEDDPARGRQMLNAMGHHMDEALETLRTLARGIYPALLDGQGLSDALKSVARRSPVPISVDAGHIGRYRRDVEAAVYFCCLEAIQNATKHAGRAATISVRLAQEDEHLHFDVRDSGVGFDAAKTGGQHGVLNMRDRIEAIGGTLAIDSWPEHGTVVSGRVPVTDARRPGEPAAL
jgi:signal transduction histidine kinase